MFFSWINVHILSVMLISCISGNAILENVADTLIEVLESERYNINGNTNNEQNQLCAHQLLHFLNALANRDFWALKVADSWGKIPSGMLSGNFYQYGNFDQCLVSMHESSINNAKFKGQYCLSQITSDGNSISNSNFATTGFLGQIRVPVTALNHIAKNETSLIGSVSLYIAACIPDSCSPEFLTHTFNTALHKLANITQTKPIFKVTFSDAMCQTKTETEYGPMDIFAIFFFSAVAATMVISTAYDLLMIRQNKARNPNLIAFSVYTNGEKLFKCSRTKSPDVMECINGIRVLSITWVVIGHTYSFFMVLSLNIIDIIPWVEKPHSMLIVAASISVDTFFLLSGILVAFNMLKHLDSNKGKLNIPLLYLHRYLRLTPALAAVVLMQSTLYRYFGSGPLWKMGDQQSICAKYWWSTLLYVQNYVNPEQSCFGPSWYLMVDMQLFVLSPLIVYPLWRWRNKFIPMIPALVLLSMACTFTTFMVNHYNASKLNAGNDIGRYEKTYVPAHTRFGAWGIGILFGYILHVTKSKPVQLSNIFTSSGWVISFGTMLSIIFGYYPMNQIGASTTDFESAAYESFSRVCWAISVGWIIFACVNGYGSSVNWFLSLPQWQPLGRLSYSVYLLHCVIQFVRQGSMRTPKYFTDFNAIHTFWGDFGLSLCAAVLWTLAFESPILILEKLLLGGRKSNSSLKQSEENLVSVSNESKKIPLPLV